MLGQVAADHPDAIERFKQEAISASHIEHDNIVNIITLRSTEDGHLFIVMELLKGQSLAKALEQGHMGPDRALPIVYQISSALHAAHEAGIIHRDLKPENVYITKKGDAEFVKILDFGISKIHDVESDKVGITKTGHVLGTPLYMSPEQAKGMTRLDRRADIYSLGVILYEMVSGEPPFSGENYFQLIWKHSNEPPPEVKADVPEALKQVISRALAKDPGERFATMLDLEQALADALPEIPPPAFLLDFRPTTSPHGAARPSSLSGVTLPRRRRGMVLAVAAVVLVASGVGLALALQGRDGSERRASVIPASDDDAATAEDRGPEPAAGDALEARGDGEAAPATIRLSVGSDPPGGRVFLGAEELGTTPLALERARSSAEMELRIEKVGYVTATQRVTLAEDVDVSVRLAKRGSRPRDGGSLPFKTDF
jgi:serine/threonine-protein kinase